MSGIPIQTYLFPVLMLVVVGFMYFRGLKLRAQTLRDNPQYGFGALAQRWQLQLVEGDPTYNLLLNDRDALVARHVPPLAGMSGDTPPRSARMVGQHREHPVQFEFYDQTHLERGVLEITHTRNYRCALSVGVRAPFAPFEITLRHENQYLVTERRIPAPEQAFGQAALDQALRLGAADPRVGPAIAPFVGALTVMTYVHVVATDGAVRFEMSPLGTTYGAYYAETVLQTLLAIADVLEGRPAVAPAPPPPPMAG